MHWADKYAKEIIERDPDKERYVVESAITPSGVVHAGNFREILTQDFVYRALKRKREKAKFIYVWDDFDRFRKVPKGVPDNFSEYIGLPVSSTPDPWECHESYSEHFIAQAEEEARELDIEADFIKMSEEYPKSIFADEIKTALEKKEQIRQILNKYRSKPRPEGWMPTRTYCEECGKDTTQQEYLGDYKIKYKCKCGHENTFDFRKKGIIKLKWRVDWPMRWKHYGIDFESAGKEHHASGGSWDTGIEISKQIYKNVPPVGPMYEFIKSGKGKMSSSEGNVVRINDLLEVYEPEIVRYLYTRKINTTIKIPFDQGIINEYNRFDRAERVYWGAEEEKNERKKENLVRSYELSQIKPEDEWKFLPQPDFAFCTIISQTTKDKEKAIKLLEEAGHVPEDLDEKAVKRIKKRLGLSKNWAEKHAPEQYKIKVLEEVPEEVKQKLSSKQKKALEKIWEAVSQSRTEKELKDEFSKAIDELDIQPKKFYEAAYLVLLNKTQGPKLNRFLKTIDKELLQKRFLELS